MRVIERQIPLDACTVAPGRPIVAIVVHHTATTTLPFPQRSGSWNYAIDRDGTIYRDVDEANIAHHVGQCDRWRPPWVTRPPAGVGVSDVNWCTLGVEVTYAPQPPWEEQPVPEQEKALRELLADLSARYGGLPVVGHGELSTDKWPTEPHGLRWEALGLGPRESDGRWLLAAGEGGNGTGQGESDVETFEALQAQALAERLSAVETALARCNDIKAELEQELRRLEARRRLKRGTTDRLIAAGRGG